MKLAYITNIKTPAGDAQSIQVQAMSRTFFKVLGDDFLFISPLDEKNKEFRSAYQWVKIKSPFSERRSIRYFWLTLLSWKMVRKFKPDYIYSRDIGVIFFYHLLGCKVIYEIHKPFETKIGYRLFSFLASKIKVVAISQALSNFVIEKYKIKSDKILVAHDGVFLEDFINLNKQKCRQELLLETNLPLPAFVVLYSGNLYIGKGLERRINTAKQLPEIFFVIVGTVADKVNHDIPKNIIFLGRKTSKQIPTYLAGANLLILPFTKNLKTWQYHSALKMFEYMASKTPILASGIGSVLEIYNTENAYLFSPDLKEDSVIKIKEIKENYKKAREKADLAFSQVKQYTWCGRADNILNFLKK